MRLMIVIAGLLLAASALAEEKPKNVTVAKELDKSSPILMSTGSDDDSTEATRAKENFDRSKPHASSPRDAASGMATGKRQHAAAPNAGGGDYNGTRSNRSSGIVHRDVAARNVKGGDLDQDGRPDVVCAKAQGNGVDDDCDSAVDEAPANHNTTRSNRSLRAAPQGSGTRAQNYNSSRSNNINGAADPVGGGGQGATRAQDYNSSRSNTTSLRLDDDSDGDSIGAEVRCSMRSDDCVDAGDNDDRVVRKKPGR